MIRRCAGISARAYKGVIPQDCWKEPYMPKEELQRQIEERVEFWRFELVSHEEKERLLRKYWNISGRQIEVSVVLADSRWMEENNPA